MEAIKRSLLIAFTIVVLLPAIVIVAYATENDLNLPSTPVRIEVFDGAESYFLTKLIDVPEGYDVTNGTYLGWCVDTRAEMTRSPATHSVFLYSSFNPPGELANEEWDMVNYILNHKPETATAEDIQQAIWYFVNIDGNYTPTSETALGIINDALENGEGYIPQYGQIVAVICYPTVLLPYPSEVQISIIEVTNTVIPEFPSVSLLLLIMLVVLFVMVIHERKRKILE